MRAMLERILAKGGWKVRVLPKGSAFEVDVTGRHNETVRIYALERQRWSSLVSDGGS